MQTRNLCLQGKWDDKHPQPFHKRVSCQVFLDTHITQRKTTSVVMHIALGVLCGSPRGESLVKATGMLIILLRGRNCLFSNEHVYYVLIK